MKILVLGGTLNHEGAKDALKKLAAESEHEYFFANDELSDQQLAEIDILLGNATGILDRIFSLEKPQLKWIQAFSAGVDYFPLDQLAKRQILLSNVSGIHAEPIAETVLGMMLSHFRGIKDAVVQQQKNHWQPADFGYTVLSDKKLAVIGTGHIGTRIAELGQAFRMETVGVNHSGHPADGFNQTLPLSQMTEAVKDAAVIVNTLPLTDETRGLYDAEFFAALETAPLFINIGRGPSVVTDDLVAALKAGQVSAAGLDVTAPEPLPEDSQLWQMDNVLITPHVSGLYQEYAQDVIKIFKENLQQYEVDGTLVRNEVDLKKGY